VLGHRLVILSDAHLGAAPAGVETALLDFLDAVPSLGDALLINGDLFDFWFAYRRVVPRHGFRVAAALLALRRRMPVVMTGGNHDRWGDDFWSREVGLDWRPGPARFAVGRRQVLAVHGDGLTEPGRKSRLIHRMISHPVTGGAYRLLHPDFGIRLVERVAPLLGDHDMTEAKLAAAAERQRQWAAAAMRAEPEIEVVIMGHTHQPELAEPEPGHWYLNPGAWMFGHRYAVVTERTAELLNFRP
jgi:UDP-2,3-diacylglucosamine hydrolase